MAAGQLRRHRSRSRRAPSTSRPTSRPSGHYAADAGYFAAAGVDNPPLHALKDGVSGGNGVYAYGASSTFPNNTFGAANYWVDVVFASGAATAPAAPTGVTATRRERVGDGELDGAVGRREPDHELHGHPVHRDDRADADDGDRQPAGDHRHRHRA